jgi:hypothetical protein
MNITEIKLGDTIRLSSGKEVVVFAVYGCGEHYEICAEVLSGFILDNSALNDWALDSNYHFVDNRNEFLGKRVAWLSSTYSVDCIVKAACLKECAIDTKPGKLRLERPCPQCSRMNDIGVGQCWRCERPNP